MIDDIKKVSVTVWFQAFHTNPCFILCLLKEKKKITLTKSLFICQEIVQNLENEHTKPVVLLPKPLGCEFPRSDARGAVSPSAHTVNARSEADPSGIAFS